MKVKILRQILIYKQFISFVAVGSMPTAFFNQTYERFAATGFVFFGRGRLEFFIASTQSNFKFKLYKECLS